MSNYLILVSDKKFDGAIKNDRKVFSLKNLLNFGDIYSLDIIPSGDVDKLIEARDNAPEIYKETCMMYDKIYSDSASIIKNGGKAGLILTYIGQDLDSVNFKIKDVNQDLLKQEHLELDFDTIYNMSNQKYSCDESNGCPEK